MVDLHFADDRLVVGRLNNHIDQQVLRSSGLKKVILQPPVALAYVEALLDAAPRLVERVVVETDDRRPAQGEARSHARVEKRQERAHRSKSRK